jgi:hypothetical protein
VRAAVWFDSETGKEFTNRITRSDDAYKKAARNLFRAAGTVMVITVGGLD